MLTNMNYFSFVVSMVWDVSMRLSLEYIPVIIELCDLVTESLTPKLSDGHYFVKKEKISSFV